MRGLKRAAFAVMAACLLATGARAQETDALPVTPEKLALAQQVVEANGTDAMTKRMMEAVTSAMTKGMGLAGDQAVSGLIQKILREEMADMQVKMRPLYAEVYAKVYTGQELADLLAFYRSPTGQALVAKAPRMMEQSQLLAAPLLPAMQRDMVVKLFDQLCTVKTCTPQMRQQIAAGKQTMLDRLNAQAAATAAAQAAMPH